MTILSNTQILSALHRCKYEVEPRSLIFLGLSVRCNRYSLAACIQLCTTSSRPHCIWQYTTLTERHRLPSRSVASPERSGPHHAAAGRSEIICFRDFGRRIRFSKHTLAPDSDLGISTRENSWSVSVRRSRPRTARGSQIQQACLDVHTMGTGGSLGP